MKIIYLAVLDPSQHKRAFWSATTVLKFNPTSKIYIYTDKPAYFDSIKEKVNVIKIEDILITEWKSEYNYIFLCKLEAMRMMDSSFIYLDNDTYVTGNIDEIANKIDESNSLMHVNEGKIKDENKSLKQRLSQTVYRYIAACFDNRLFDDDLFVWNAGVVGMHDSNLHLVKEMIDLTKQFLKISKTVPVLHTLEMLALSIVLQRETTLHETKSHIAHYWPFKPSFDDYINKKYTFHA